MVDLVKIYCKQFPNEKICHHCNFTPLKNLIRTADDSSNVIPVTDLNEAPQRGADSNLHRYKTYDEYPYRLEQTIPEFINLL
jgi:hypothetical protein